MKNLLITIVVAGCLFLTSNPTFSQYNSTFEEEAFLNFEKDSANAYDLLFAINYNKEQYETGKTLIDEHVGFLKSKNIQNKSLKKQIQTIYKTTHSKFLMKYEAEADFCDIFINGNYNCVSASALYALIFEQFEINYAIKETPTHVYLIADTLGLQTLIESTLPGNGVMSFSEKFKKDYVEYLNSNKIISDNEFDNSTTDQLFNKFYSEDKSISIFELAAIQYYNKGIFLMEEEKFSGAATFFDKALAIYDSHSISYFHYAALHNALLTDLNKKEYDGKLFGKVLQSSKKDSTLVQIADGYFEDVSIGLCVNDPDINRYNRFYKDIQLHCPEENIPVAIAFRYHFYKAYNFGVNGEYPLSLSEIKIAFRLNQDNLLVKELAQQIGTKHLLVEGSFKKQIDSLEHYFTELPFLSEYKLFQQQLVYCYMKVISESCEYDELNEGEKYYDRFTQSLEKYDIKYFSENHIDIGFSVLAMSKRKKEKYTEAMQVVDKGLDLVPASLRLKQVKEAIEEARNWKKQSDGYYSKSEREKDVYPLLIHEPADALREKIDKYFPGKWKAVSIIIEDTEQDLTSNEVFEFDAESNKDCTYTKNGISEKGKWAYRPKSKCIYFVPDYDKDKYKVFRLKEVNADEIVLLPYKDQKTPSPYRFVLKPVE